jgi:hypothetical protein
MSASRTFLIAAVALTAFLVSPSARCFAGFKLMFQQQGFADQVIGDRFAGDGGTGSSEDLSGLQGKIRLGGALDPITDEPVPFEYGTFRIEIVTGTSNSPGSTERGILDIVSVLITNLSGTDATLTISMTDTGFTSPSDPLVLNSLLNVGVLEGTADVSFTSYATDGNVEFGTAFATSTLQASLDGSIPSGVKLSSSKDGFTYTTTYSLTNVAEYTLSAGGVLNVSSGKTTLLTPAPSSLAALLGGLPILWVMTLRRKKLFGCQA